MIKHSWKFTLTLCVLNLVSVVGMFHFHNYALGAVSAFIAGALAVTGVLRFIDSRDCARSDT